MARLDSTKLKKATKLLKTDVLLLFLPLVAKKMTKTAVARFRPKTKHFSW